MGTVDNTLLKLVSQDRAIGSALLFKHRHPQESAKFHVEMIDLWRCSDEFVIIEGHRESAKSTLAEEFLALEGCYGNFPYALILGETYMKACQRLEAIAVECSRNVKLHSLFGGKVLARRSIENRVWFKSGAMIEAVGWEQELQSFKYLDYRPWRVYADDPENKERVRDKASVDETMRKLFLELIPAMDKTNRKLRITQTRRAEDCMVVRLSTNPEWVYRAFPICNGDIDAPDTQSNWPARYPMEWIRKERDSYRAAGMLGEFLQAYMLQASNPDERPFKQDNIRFMDMAPHQWMPRYVIYDPARTDVKGKSDEYGKVVVSRFGSQILVHESAGENWKPDAMIKDVFDANDKHHPAKIGIEKNSLDEWLLQPMRLESMKRGEALPLKALQAPQDRNKNSFILGLQPFFQAKDIVLIGGQMAHPKLVAEILNFPQGSKNILNALAYSLSMFSGQPLYEDFCHANIGDAPEPRFNETVYVAFNATPSETVAVAVLRSQKSLFVAADFSQAGTPSEAVKFLSQDLRATFPKARFSIWVPAEIYDQWQRVPLVPALRAASLNAFRGEHIAVARGCLSDKIRTVIRQRRMLMVDPGAQLTANALASGYCYPVQKGGIIGGEPEAGISKLIGEALENLTFTLSASLNTDAQLSTNAANAQGVMYHSALPQPSRR